MVREISSSDQVNINSGVFDNVGRAFIGMFTMFSTENYPDLMFPAYHFNHALLSEWSSLYFVIYLYLGMFFFNAVIIGVIIDAYWSVSKAIVKTDRIQIRKSLAIGWNELLKGDDLSGLEGSNQKIAVDDERLIKLFAVLKPNNTEDENKNLLHMLDTVQEHSSKHNY